MSTLDLATGTAQVVRFGLLGSPRGQLQALQKLAANAHEICLAGYLLADLHDVKAPCRTQLGRLDKGIELLCDGMLTALVMHKFIPYLSPQARQCLDQAVTASWLASSLLKVGDKFSRDDASWEERLKVGDKFSRDDASWEERLKVVAALLYTWVEVRHDLGYRPSTDLRIVAGVASGLATVWVARHG